MSGDPPKVRAVFDCMIFLQGAARRESPAGICLLLVELGVVELYLSPEIINELRDVLTRPRLRVRFPALTDLLVNEFLKSLERQAVFIRDVPHIFSYERDPKDEPYINLALAAKATHLVSRDKDILDLAKQSNPEGERLRKNSEIPRIVDPITFLLDLRHQP